MLGRIEIDWPMHAEQTELGVLLAITDTGTPGTQRGIHFARVVTDIGNDPQACNDYASHDCRLTPLPQ